MLMRSVAVLVSRVCVMGTTLAAKEPCSWFNSEVISWANSDRDLHLTLGEAIRPGTRGVRELLVNALRDAVRSGQLATGMMLPPSRSLAGDPRIAAQHV